MDNSKCPICKSILKFNSTNDFWECNDCIHDFTIELIDNQIAFWCVIIPIDNKLYHVASNNGLLTNDTTHDSTSLHDYKYDEILSTKEWVPMNHTSFLEDATKLVNRLLNLRAFI